MGVALFVLVMTNFIMNVAAIAICLPVALVIARYLGVAGEVILFSSLVAAGMPFLLLIGAAPNAIAYGSGQFTSGEFFKAGVPASILLMVVLGVLRLVRVAAHGDAGPGEIDSEEGARGRHGIAPLETTTPGFQMTQAGPLLRRLRRLFSEWHGPQASHRDARIRLLYDRFREILSINDNVLQLIADVEEKASGRVPFAPELVAERIRRTILDAFVMVKNLNQITDGRFRALYDAVGRLDTEIERLLPMRPEQPVGPLVIPIASCADPPPRSRESRWRRSARPAPPSGSTFPMASS